MSAPAAAGPALTPRQQAIFELLLVNASEARDFVAGDLNAALPDFVTTARKILKHLVLELSSIGGETFVDAVLAQILPIFELFVSAYDDDDALLNIRYRLARPTLLNANSILGAQDACVWALSQRLAKRDGLLHRCVRRPLTLG